MIGVGNRESASELLIANCDEFIFYDLLAAQAAGSTPRRSGGGGLNPLQLLQETLTALQREGTEWPLASVVKDSMRRKYPAFDESEHGFSTFSKFLEEAATAGIVRIETDPRSGTYRVELAGGAASPLPQAPVGAPLADRASDEGDGRRRRRRGGRRADPATAESTAGDEAEGDGDAEVFEVVVTPTPDLDVGTLPPLDEPISYEDMIMLGPEVGEDVPELAEASDMEADGEPPSRSSRRRRRRAAADPEPTVADLEPLDPSEVAELLEPVIDEEPEIADTVPEDDEAAPRRRRRRRISATEDETPAEAPGEEAIAVPEAPAAVEEAPAAVEEAPAVPGRRRVRRRATAPAEAEPAPAAEIVLEAAPPAEAEVASPADLDAPKPKRRTRRAAPKAEAEAEVAAPAEAVAEAAPAADLDAPKPKRRTRRAAPKAEAEAVVAIEAAPPDEADAPTPKRRTRRAAPKKAPVGAGSEPG